MDPLYPRDSVLDKVIAYFSIEITYFRPLDQLKEKTSIK